MPDLIEVLNTHPLVLAEAAPVFQQWDKYFDTLYKRPTAIKKMHCFEIGKEQGDTSTTLCMRRSNHTDTLTKKELLLPANQAATRLQLLGNRPEDTPAPGLRTIKKVEMSKKYAPLVPLEYRQRLIYQAPSEDEYTAFLKQKKASKAQKRQDETANKQK